MNDALTPGSSVLVATAGRRLRGTVLRIARDGFIVVRLDGERGADEWHPALVEAAQ